MQKVISGTVSKKLIDIMCQLLLMFICPLFLKNINEGIGIDLGLKDFAICSKGEKYKNINKTEKNKKNRK